MVPKLRGVGNIQGGGDAVVDLGGYSGNKKICHMALSNYTARTLFHFVIFKNFLAGGGHPLLHHPRSKLYNLSYIRMVAFLFRILLGLDYI